MKTFLLGLAVVAATLLGGTTAQAAFLNGTAVFSAVDSGAFGGNLANRTYTSQNKTVGTGDYSAPAIPDVANAWAGFAINNTTGGGIASISNAAFGNFTVTSVISDTTVPNSNRTIQLKGLFTGGTQLAGFDPTVSNLTISVSQTATGQPSPIDFFYQTNVILTSSGAVVPEPTSIALFGLGALGLVARRFRRK